MDNLITSNIVLFSTLPSDILAFTEKAAELKGKGVNIINFAEGEPDFNTPDNIKEATQLFKL